MQPAKLVETLVTESSLVCLHRRLLDYFSYLFFAAAHSMNLFHFNQGSLIAGPHGSLQPSAVTSVRAVATSGNSV